MNYYVLHYVPVGLIDRVRMRAQKERWLVQDLIFQLMEDYARGKATPSRPAPEYSMPANSSARRHGAPIGAPLRTVRITFADSREPQRLQVAAATELGLFLVLFDQHDQVIARFLRHEVLSWYLE
jgi:hypothetical protein